MYDTELSDSSLQHRMYSIDIYIYKKGIIFPYLYIFTGIEMVIERFSPKYYSGFLCGLAS